HSRQLGYRMSSKTYCQCGFIQSVSCARFAGNRLPFVPLVPPDLLAALLLVESGHPQTGPVARGAPAVTRVVGEEARVELGKARAAGRTGALYREDCLRHAGECRIALHHRALQGLQRADDMDEALAVVEGALQRRPQARLFLRRSAHVGDWELDGVF